MSEKLHSDYIFNSALETGIRSLCILVANLSKSFDLQQLLALDHIVVHSGDIENAPTSLHPNILQKSGELLVRRPLVESGLVLMESKRLVKKIITPNGFYYKATELACVFIDSLSNEYIQELKKRACWAVEMYVDLGEDLFLEVFNSAFEKWRNEFQLIVTSIKRND